MALLGDQRLHLRCNLARKTPLHNPALYQLLELIQRRANRVDSRRG